MQNMGRSTKNVPCLKKVLYIARRLYDGSGSRGRARETGRQGEGLFESLLQEAFDVHA